MAALQGWKHFQRSVFIFIDLRFNARYVGLYRTSLSGPEVRQIFKVRTHQKPDVLLPGRRTFITWKNGGKKSKKIKKKKKNSKKIFKIFFKIFCFFCLFNWSGNFRHQIFVQVPYLMKSNNLLLVGETFKNISPDSVRSGRTCPANLGVRSCPVRKLICPVRSSPRFLAFNSSSFKPIPKYFVICFWNDTHHLYLMFANMHGSSIKHHWYHFG